jgi:hypothetical protein
VVSLQHRGGSTQLGHGRLGGEGLRSQQKPNVQQAARIHVHAGMLLVVVSGQRGSGVAAAGPGEQSCCLPATGLKCLPRQPCASRSFERLRSTAGMALTG